MPVVDPFVPLREWRSSLYRSKEAVIDQFLDRIDVTLSAGWVRDSAYEQTRPRPDLIRCYLFDRAGEAAVRVWLQRVTATRERGGPVQLLRHPPAGGFEHWPRQGLCGFSFRISCPASGTTTCRRPDRDGETGIRAFTATWQIAADLGQPAPPLPVLPPGTLIDDLEQLSRDLLTAATELDRDHTGMSWAIDRVAAKRKPSSAKGPVKDCHILGHSLGLSTLLGAGYPNSLVLVNSNRSDFAAPNATVFHPDIATEAADAGLEYTY